MDRLEKVIKGLEELRRYADNEIHPVVSPDNWIVYSRLIDLIEETENNVHAVLKAQEPRVMTLEEVKHLTYGSPYIIETNLPKEEPRLMYGLFSHLGLQGNFTFAFTNARWYLFDSDYGKHWRCWTSRPTGEQREATLWTQTNGL